MKGKKYIDIEISESYMTNMLLIYIESQLKKIKSLNLVFCFTKLF